MEGIYNNRKSLSQGWRVFFKILEILGAYGGGKGQNILNIQKSFVPVKSLS